MHYLDRPVWASLSTYHASLSEGGPLARRYVRGVNLFVSACDDSDVAAEAMTHLIEPDERGIVLQVPEVVIPPQLHAASRGKGVQMVAKRDLRSEAAGDDLIPLSDSDAREMLALATLTQPGPFLARTPIMGEFLGIRVDGKLVAMAGERMRMPGCTEVSAVCTHPDFTGRGYAARLSTAVTAAIQARGDQPFLHAWKTNVRAISLYERLGFEHRIDVNVAVLERNPLPQNS
jgi:predicted GNAT family acetyltransferase